MRLDLAAIPAFVKSVEGVPKFQARLAACQSALTDAGLRTAPFLGQPGPMPQSHADTERAFFETVGANAGPLLLLEDDATFDAPPGALLVDCPDDADALYLGLSRWSLPRGKRRGSPFPSDLRASPVPEHPALVRIENMLASHAILYVTPRYRAACAEALRANPGVAGDVLFAELQPRFRVYAQRRPLFYQGAALGGQEVWTRFTL